MDQTERPPPVFAEGYFADRIHCGEHPDHKEPFFPLPKLPQNTPPMTVETGFLAARRRPA